MLIQFLLYLWLCSIGIKYEDATFQIYWRNSCKFSSSSDDEYHKWGAHANNNLDIQELMIVPYGFDSFSESLRCGCEIFQVFENNAVNKGISSAVGDEGGFSPSLENLRRR